MPRPARCEDLSGLAGVRISMPRATDAGRTYFEIYIKATGEIVSRDPSYTNLIFTVRGKDRRRHPRAVANERRALQHRNGVSFFSVENGVVVRK